MLATTDKFTEVDITDAVLPRPNTLVYPEKEYILRKAILPYPEFERQSYPSFGLSE